MTKSNKISFSLPPYQLCRVHKKRYSETECGYGFIHIMESDPFTTNALYINCLVMLWHHIGAKNNEPNLIMYFLSCYLFIRFFRRFIYFPFPNSTFQHLLWEQSSKHLKMWILMSAVANWKLTEEVSCC